MPHSTLRTAIAWPMRLVGVQALCLGLAACGSLPRNATPAQSARDGGVPGSPEVRGWAGQSSPTLEHDLVRSFAHESAQDSPPGASGTVPCAVSQDLLDHRPLEDGRDEPAAA